MRWRRRGLPSEGWRAGCCRGFCCFCWLFFVFCGFVFVFYRDKRLRVVKNYYVFIQGVRGRFMDACSGGQRGFRLCRAIY